jgi:hypothetical protein
MWCPSFVKQFAKFVVDEMKKEKEYRYILLYNDDDYRSHFCDFKCTRKELPARFYEEIFNFKMETECLEFVLSQIDRLRLQPNPEEYLKVFRNIPYGCGRIGLIEDQSDTFDRLFALNVFSAAR